MTHIIFGRPCADTCLPKVMVLLIRKDLGGQDRGHLCMQLGSLCCLGQELLYINPIGHQEVQE